MTIEQLQELVDQYNALESQQETIVRTLYAAMQTRSGGERRVAFSSVLWSVNQFYPMAEHDIERAVFGPVINPILGFSPGE